jgi:hypothetical protein
MLSEIVKKIFSARFNDVLFGKNHGTLLQILQILGVALSAYKFGSV